MKQLVDEKRGRPFACTDLFEGAPAGFGCCPFYCCCTLHRAAARNTQQSCGCCTHSVSSVASTLGLLEPGLVAKAKIGHGEGRRSPRGSTARARQAPSANLMLTGRDQSTSCQTKSSQDQQKTSFHFQVKSKLRHHVTSLCHVNRCLTCELLVFYTA